jgi:PAS domain S-box-containing protein
MEVKDERSGAAFCGKAESVLASQIAAGKGLEFLGDEETTSHTALVGTDEPLSLPPPHCGSGDHKFCPKPCKIHSEFFHSRIVFLAGVFLARMLQCKLSMWKILALHDRREGLYPGSVQITGQSLMKEEQAGSERLRSDAQERPAAGGFLPKEGTGGLQTEAESAQKVLAAIVECSSDAILSKNLDGTILSWNQGAESLFGFSPNEVVGQSIYSLIPENSRGDEAEILRKVTNGERVYHYETARLRKDGSVVEVSLSASPVRNAEGKIIGASTIARDISERKKADVALREAKDRLATQAQEAEILVSKRTEQLTASNKQLEAFVYSVAHDLRAPLRALQGFSSLLIQEYATSLDERGLDFATRIKRAAQVMDALLEDLLAFSRVSQQNVVLTPLALKTVVAETVDRLKEEIQRSNAIIEMTGDWPSVLAHEATLGQVLNNLISNAIKFVEPAIQPVVRLWTEPRGEMVRIWVADNGIGIASQYHEHIFQLFTRLCGKAYPGTGLGLAIVQKGIERMGGSVGVESRLGTGSHFWFELRKA